MVPTSPCAICRVDATDGCVRCGDVLCHEHAPPRGDQRCERCERAYRARVTSLRVATAIPVGVLALGLSGFAAMMAALFLSLPPEITIFLVLLGELAGGAFLTRQVDRLVSRTMRRRFLDGTDVAIPEARLLRGGGA